MAKSVPKPRTGSPMRGGKRPVHIIMIALPMKPGRPVRAGKGKGKR